MKSPPVSLLSWCMWMNHGLPGPIDPKATPLSFARDSCTSSLTLRAGTLGLNTSTSGIWINPDTGTKSRTAS